MLLFLLAQTADLESCGGNQLPPQYRICLEQSYELQRKKLALEYINAVRSIKQFNTIYPQQIKYALDSLDAAQKSWIAYRKKECDSKSSAAFGGSHEDLYLMNCLVSMTEDRTKALRELSKSFSND